MQEKDLVSIRDYIAQDNQDAAVVSVKDLLLKIKSLADNGVQGSPLDWVSFGLRVCIYKDRGIYFRINEDQMIIVRILNVRQDVTAQIS